MRYIPAWNLILSVIVIIAAAVSYSHVNFSTKSYVDDKHKEVMKKLDVIDNRLYELTKGRNIR